MRDLPIFKPPTNIERNYRILPIFLVVFTPHNGWTEIYCKKKIIDSLIGKDVKIKERGDLPKGQRFIIGDSSEVEV